MTNKFTLKSIDTKFPLFSHFPLFNKDAKQFVTKTQGIASIGSVRKRSLPFPGQQW